MFDAKMKFKTSTLIKILEKNRDKHIKDYEDAKKVYQKKLVKAIENKLKAARTGRKVDHYIDLSVPEQHIKDYDNILAMLKSTSNTEVELDSKTYLQVSKDEWHWSTSFLNNTLGYKGGK